MKTDNPSNPGKVASGFVGEVRSELSQVIWPSRQRTLKLTMIVIGVSVVVGVYLGALDYLLTNLIGLII
jgi:preprotein translocase subunit SecE